MGKKIKLKNTWKPGTQNYFIVEHLNIKRSITQVEAETVYKIRRLASRISEINSRLMLGNLGNLKPWIECEMRCDLMGQKYGKYSIQI